MTKLKQTLLATASGVVLAGSAQAADLPLKAAPAAIPISNWTGPYIGAHLGVGGMDAFCGNAASNGGLNGSCTGHYAGEGGRARDINVLAGVQAGYDWQSRYLVYGIAADWTWTNLKGKAWSTSASISWESKVNWLASFRGRAGLAVENTMVYLTAGLGVGGFTDVTNQGRTSEVSLNKTRVGWVAGAGVEHKWTRNWSVELLYLHYDFGQWEEIYANPTNGSSYHHRFSKTVDVARLGVNYRW